jgi:hypothetical protein
MRTDTMTAGQKRNQQAKLAAVKRITAALADMTDWVETINLDRYAGELSHVAGRLEEIAEIRRGIVNYTEFLGTKRKAWEGSGLGISGSVLPTALYPWQRAVTEWALRKERACIFADCGLGKTLMQLAWADAVPGRVLVLAPLCVGEQTAREAARLGIDAAYAARPDHETAQITITNYERLHLFDVERYAGVVLDESSILKSFDGKTRTILIASFRSTPYRLCCTATPSPNDISELANHAEFLGLMTRPEFLATWFVHDDGGWRMKGHAGPEFYRWMASWAVAFRQPIDLGYPDDRFTLPDLDIRDHVVETPGETPGALFPELALKGIGGRLRVRRASVESRADVVQALCESDDQHIVWCGLNAESQRVARVVSDSREVCGADSYEAKRDAILSFVDGRVRVLVTKPKILGFGMNFQQCSEMSFLGLSDSYETYYQCIRRCYRFGQRRPVRVHIVVSDAERAVVENVRRKEQDASAMTTSLLEHLPNEVTA